MNLRHALRLLARTPGVTATALIALALAIGANTAMFSLVDAVLIRPLPFPDADGVAMVWEENAKIGFPRNTPAPANWRDWREQNTVFTSIAGTRHAGYTITGGGPPERLIGRRVTADLWNVLGTPPLLGRTFTEQEDKNDAKVAVIGYALWQRRFGGDRSAIGRKILLNDEPFIVIGVMPPRFSFPWRGVEIWTPAGFTPELLARRGSHFMVCVARLRPGVTVQQANAQMRLIMKRLEERYPDTNKGIGAEVVPIAEQMAGESRRRLIVLFAASGFVLLIACANVANLLLARAQGRRREIAVRAALGAGRGAIVRQLLAESLLLSGIGAFLGMALAKAAMLGLEKLVPPTMAAEKLTLDLRVLAFTTAATVLTGLLFGAFPALTLGRTELHTALRQGGRGSSGGGHWVRDGLVMLQTALALTLVAGAGLMVQTLYNLQNVDIGMRSDHLLTLNTDLPNSRYPDQMKRFAFATAVLEKVRAIPGVTSAGYTSNLPMTATGNTNTYVLEHQTRVQAFRSDQDALFRVVTAGFLETIGGRLREGRFLSDADREGTVPVILVNETLANRHWPGQSPLGRRLDITATDQPRPLTIVGVVREIRDRGINIEKKPAIYMPAAQAALYWPQIDDLAIRTAVEPESIVSAVRQAIWSVDRDQPIADVRTMDDVIGEVLVRERHQMALFAAFAALALVLAATGLYGVISYVVSQRRREIGVRMALGATPGEILGSVFRRGFLLVGAGAVAGLALALASARLVRSLLFGVEAQDPRTAALAAAVLAAVGIAACLAPARAASRVDPVIVLRDE